MAPRRPGVALSAEFAPAATYARGTTYFIAIALPGFDKTRPPAAGDLVVKVEQRQIEVQIKDTLAAGVAGRRGRRFGTRVRTFPLPPGADHTKASASYSKGVLTVAVPLLEFHPLTG